MPLTAHFSPCLRTLIMLGLITGHVQAAADDHAFADQLAAEAVKLMPSAAKSASQVLAPAAAGDKAIKGEWTLPIPWTPHIPTTAAVLPDGRLLTFSSNQRTTFPDGPQFTYAAVWDPATGQFTEINNPSHDMFCGGVSMLQDGRLMVNGGNGINGTTALSSLFDWRTNQWTQVQTMADGRWYNTSVALPNGEVFTASGNGGGNANGTLEQWNTSSGWRSMSGIPWAAVSNPPIANAIETNWHPFLLVAPDGRLAHFGPFEPIRLLNTSGTGSMTTTTAQIPGTHYPKQGSWAMYEAGKVVVAGGYQSIDNGTIVNTAFKVDLNSATPVITATNAMANARSFANAVVLPNGEVMVVGGNTSGQFFSDAGTVFTPEVWNPTTEAWRAMADMTVPRNYHSLALLLTDGRVWSGGGGLSGDPVTDHQDAQVFTPPQLFNADDTAATRPTITAAPDRIGPGVTFTVNASPGVQFFSFIRLASLTHSVTTDQRFVKLTHTSPSSGVYSVASPSSINVLTPGYWMLYAVNASGVWSVSRVIQVTNQTLPIVTNPGQQSMLQNSAVSLQINASTGTGTLSYTANVLPAGLSINASSGLINGNVTAAPGTYQSTVFATANGQTSSVTFKWIILLPNLGSGQIAREWWTELAGVSVASLTSNAAYPANPKGRDLTGSFETPSNWDDNMGQRVRGFLHVPVTGQYRFYIASDDQSSLRLSTSANPTAATEIASQPDWTPPRTYTWYPQQTSALITLNAGTKYYIEALMKDGASDDHLSVAWLKPGDTLPAVINGTYLSPYLPVANPAIAWSFDESAWNGTTGEAKSAANSLFALNGTAAAGATTTTSNPALAGNPGTFRSGTFNGSAQRVSIPFNAALNPNDFTIAAWVRVDAPAGTARCVLNAGNGFGLWVNATGQWQLRTSSNLSGTSVVQGQWTHVAATFRTTSTSGSTRTGLRRLYVNGLKVAESTGSYTPNTSLPFLIGAADAAGASPFKGAIDEVALHHAPLSPEDVITLRDLRHAFGGNQSPVVTNPGTQNSLLNASISLPINATDPEGDPLTFSATGLPTGLTISPSSGVISGTVTVAGSYNVTVTASDNISPPGTASFVWNVTTGLTLGTLSSTPKPVNTAIALTATSSNGVNPRFKWNFGDGSPETAWSTNPSTTKTYTAPGRYTVTLTATDDTGVIRTRTLFQAVHAVLTSTRPASSSSIAFEDLATGNDRIWCVNPDNNSVSGFDAVTLTRIAEINVGTSPRALAFAPNGRLWVVNTESGTISIINTSTFAVASTVTLARGSRPFGLVFHTGTARAWLALEGTNRILRLSITNGSTSATINLTSPPRHLSISADGGRLYASRFISPPVPGENTATPNLTGKGGEITVISTGTLSVEKTILLAPSTAADTETSSRGLPNYLGAAVISPDGLSAWVPSKLDNIQRGIFRDNKPLNHENTVRAIVSRLDLVTQAEHLPSRIDIDNAGMPSAAAFDPWGMYVFTALEASRDVAILDAWSRTEVLRFPAGRAPQGLVTSPDGLRLFAHNFMDRTITVHNIASIIQGGNTAPVTTATLNCITTEKLTATVLNGKRLFYDAKDPRLALQEYMSCATCHNDGGHDGRVWDLTGFGEGLRNTITLKGHGAHGLLHWSANFDEVQDFENQIRGLAGGTGLITTGTPNPPMGTPNAGRSADLDALAAYVTSLTSESNSPSRTSSGALSTAATAGQQVFRAQNCAACHSGTTFSNTLQNIGTLKPSSGKRLNGTLTGIDVPALRGTWATAPYLHDGSATTLSAAITAHAGVVLSATDLSNLAAFVQSIDSQPATAPLPFTVALTTPSLNVTAPFTVTATFNAATTNFIASDVTVTNGTLSNFTGSGTTYTFRITPTAVGAVSVRVAASMATDSTLLGNLASNTLSVNFTSTDTTRPTVALTTPSTHVSAPFVVTATFSEVVTGLLANELVVTNGSVTALSTAGAVWSATITPTAAGSVSVQVPANVAQDAANNTNTASNTLAVIYTPPAVNYGVTGTYYAGKNFETLRFSRVDPQIEFDWSGAPDPQLPADGFSVRWTGCIVATTSGTYDIVTRSDDGVRLWLNGTQRINNWTNHGETWDYATITLTAGTPVPFVMEFYENTGGAMARLWWQSATVPFQAIPNANLRINENGMTFAPYPATYAEWLASGRAGSPQAADSDDVSDLMEYALGTSATTGIQEASKGLRLEKTATGTVNAVIEVPSTITDLIYSLETSTDLKAWAPSAIVPAVAPASPGLARITWSAVPAIARLRITHSSGQSIVGNAVAAQILPLNTGVQTFGLNVTREPLFIGKPSVIAANVLTFAESITLNSHATSGEAYYAEFSTGERIDVLSFGSSTLTLQSSPSATVGTLVTIRPHATLGSTFDKTYFAAGAAPNLADQVLFLVNGSFQPHYLVQLGQQKHWAVSGDATLANLDAKILPPGTGVMLRMLASPSLPFITTGHVRTSAYQRPLAAGYQLFANPWPIPLTPETASLTSSSFFASSSQSLADQFQLWKGDSSRGGSGYTGFWFVQLTAQPPFWTLSGTASLLSQNQASLLLPGRATFIQVRPAPASRASWQIPAP